MPNNAPIYTRVGDVSSDGTSTFAGVVLTATGDYTGVSANHQLVFTADTTSGSLVKGLRFKAVGTNIQTVARIYVNNGSANTTATNNQFIGEVNLPATTASNNSATVDIDYPFPNNGIVLNPGFRIYVGVATTVASGWDCTAFGGKY